MKITKDKVTYVTIGNLQEQIGKGCERKFDLYDYCLEGADVDANSWYAVNCHVLAPFHEVLDLVLEVLKDETDIEFVTYPDGIKGKRVVSKLSLEDRIKMFTNALKIKAEYEGKTGHDLPFVLFEWM